MNMQSEQNPVVVLRQEGLYIERRHVMVDAPPEKVYREFSTLGGDRGWLFGTWLWQLRGLVGKIFGGIGFRRGRRHPEDLQVGDAVDFMRVEKLAPGRMLRLKLEDKIPGQFWLQFESQALPNGRTRLVQTLFVDSRGLLGLLYWYLTYPLHRYLFGNMAQRIARLAEETSRKTS
jgi:hypothetical protein